MVPGDRGTNGRPVLQPLNDESVWSNAVIYMALDPGKTTGVAIVSSEDWSQVEVKEVIGLDVLYQLLNRVNPDCIIFERFDQRYKASTFDGVEAIAVIKLWGIQNKVTPYSQNAHQGKSFWTDDKLKEVGLHTKGKQHGRDATRHLLTHLTTQYYINKLHNLT